MTGGLNTRTNLVPNDTHAADLTGTVLPVITSNNIYLRVAGDSGQPTSSIDGSVETSIANTTLTADEAINVGFVKWAGYIVITVGGTATLRIRKDSVAGELLVENTPIITNNFNINYDIANQDVGSTTYHVTIQTTTNYIIRTQRSATVDAVIFSGILIDAVDTHAADLTGANLSKGSSPSGGRAT